MMTVFCYHAYFAKSSELPEAPKCLPLAGMGRPPNRRVRVLTQLDGKFSLPGAVTLRLHVVRNGPFADRNTRGQPILIGGPEMDAAIEATDSGLTGRGREGGEVASDSWQEI